NRSGRERLLHSRLPKSSGHVWLPHSHAAVLLENQPLQGWLARSPRRNERRFRTRCNAEESDMRTAGIVGALIVAMTVGGPALAEKGTFKGHAVLNNTKFNEFKTPDGHPYKAAWSGEQEGLIFYNGTGSALDRMLDRAHYIVEYVGDGG